MSSQTSAPSKLSIVTSDMLLWFFLVQAVSLSNRAVHNYVDVKCFRCRTRRTNAFACRVCW